MGGRVNVRDLLGLIEADGFREVRCRGDHHIYEKAGGAGQVTVPWANRGDFLPLGTAKSIARCAGPHIEAALKDILHGGGTRALKAYIKSFKSGADMTEPQP